MSKAPTAFKRKCEVADNKDHHWVYDEAQAGTTIHAFYCTKCNRFLLSHRPKDIVPECCPDAS